MTDINRAFEWKSAEQLSGDASIPLATVNEFQNPAHLEKPTDSARRDFLKIMGAGVAVTGFAGCARPVEKIVPLVDRPPESTPGQSVWYASTCRGCSNACGIEVRTVDARPVKLEGRKGSLAGRGGLCASAQAATYDLYDPERLQRPRIRREGRLQEATLVAFDEQVLAALRTAKTVRWVGDSFPSETRSRILSSFLSGFADGKLVVHDLDGHDAALEAQAALYGAPVLPRLRLDRADRILDLASDFLRTGWGKLEVARDFAERRDVESQAEPIRLTSVEGFLTMTGTNADDRIVVRQSQVADIGLAVANEVARLRGGAPAQLQTALAPYAPDAVATATGVSAERIRAVAADLFAHRGRSLALGGGTRRLQVAAGILNELLDAEGAVLDGAVEPSRQHATGDLAMRALLEEMVAGKVDVLVLDGVNPEFTLPESAGFRQALAKVRTVIALACHVDESAELAHLVGARTHYLEEWGDARPYPGVRGLIQPTITPLYKEVRSSLDAVLAWQKALGREIPWGATTAHEAVRGLWGDIHRDSGEGGDFELFWEESLRQGGWQSKDLATRMKDAAGRRTFAPTGLEAIAPASAPQGIEIAPYLGAVEDGRQANNPILQELPDPVTKIVWGNAVLLAPQLAEKMGVDTEDLVRVDIGGKSIELPAYILPGTHPEVAAVALGYGRRADLRLLRGSRDWGAWTDAAYGTGETVREGVGADIGRFASWTAGATAFDVLPATLAKTGKGRVSSTQHHHDLAQIHESGHDSQEWRQVAIQINYEEYKKDPAAGNADAHHKLFTIWGEPEYTAEQQWGMAIDMNRCTGCSACVAACNVENNVPMVGFEEVRRHREMHWLRIDRYYHGDLADPQITHQPVLCQHCETAPCETVCPVLATTHSDDGLNQQTYNRCVGTRYCNNNCPYKVRRFNWTNNWKGEGIYDLYHKAEDGSTPNAPLALAFNPSVTVRSRGVMEKCTFCVQRIQQARYDAKATGLDKVPDGAIETACQQSCPTRAITFGDIRDPETRVSRAKKLERGYRLLEWLQVKPRVTYLPRVRHTAVAGAVSAAVAVKHHGSDPHGPTHFSPHTTPTERPATGSHGGAHSPAEGTKHGQ